MSNLLNHSSDLILLQIAGLSLFRLIQRARSRTEKRLSPPLRNDLQEGISEDIGYEAAWIIETPKAACKSAQAPGTTGGFR